MYDSRNSSSQRPPIGPAAWTSGSATPLACANCQNPLRAGAKFCTRCGAALEAQAPVRPAPIPPRRIAGPSIQRKPARPNNGRPLVAFLFPILIGIAGVVVLMRSFDRPTFMPPAPMALESVAPMGIVTDKIPLPTLPDPQTAFNSTLGDIAIHQAWIEPGAIDAGGYLGFRIDAMVSAPNSTGVRFGAHLRSRESGSVFAVDPRLPRSQRAVLCRGGCVGLESAVEGFDLRST